MFSMAPPTAPLHLDVEAISGICGSISIACWVVVFSPQILENFRRSSADGLSLQFIIVWLAGDVFNILGAVLQGVLPTMIILAIYYTIADIVLLAQCFYYRGFTWKDEVVPPAPKPRPARVPDRERDILNERTTLLDHAAAHRERRGSDWSNLSPAVPLHDGPPPATPAQPTRLQTVLWNAVAILMVCAAGVLGWFLSRRYSPKHAAGHDGHDDSDDHGADQQLAFHFWGQVFGWLCAVRYLGSRLPQILLNYRRKSTEGVSMLFFLFACLGNLTYVLSIFAYDPHCGRHGCAPGHGYARYILVNLSWLAGSMGTLLLDMGIFVQFFLYRKDDDDDDKYEGDEDEDEEEADGHSIDQDRWDQRPLLARGDTSYP
ncbi:vacuolar amino acid transporter YPQ1 like protein [Verticillium longisporum]|uniref:Vacuolar amino acid transporter YPQ1 like protein n=1 Tax=Verticillium longisporum TaxID=100787 RepID=A0A8I2ZZS2_VERLO|nr:vacuolar amino acid transporter YPQ1 like protein [Verticillium longisporum]